MSSTEIYGVKKNGDVVKVGETPDAMRGALYVWAQLAKQYDKGSVMDFSPLWELCDTPAMKQSDSEVLKTTFDDVVAMKDTIPTILDAFANFDQQFPGSSLPEQAVIIRHEILDNSEMTGVCWNQTSSLQDAWKVTDENGRQVPYNIKKFNQHFIL